MSDVISLRLDGSAKNRLDALSVKTGRSKAYYVREALHRYLDDMEYVYSVRAEHEAIKRGEVKTISLEDLQRECLES